MKADPGRIASIARVWPPELRLVLLFGPDDSASRDLAGQLVAGIAPETLTEIDGSSLKHDPQALVAAATSLSMFGGRELVRVDGLDEAGLPAVEALLSAPAGHPVVAVAGDLKAANKLRQAAEKHAAIAACAQYEATLRDAPKLLAEMAAPLGLRLERGVAETLFASAAGDRQVMRRELEKYALFKDSAADNPQRLDADDLAALGIASGEAELFAPIAAITTGDVATASDLLARLPDGTAIPLLRGLERRFVQLIALRVEVDAGRSPDAVVEGARAIFFKEKPIIAKALAIWTQDRLRRAMGEILAAERAVKASGGLADVGAHAMLLAMTRRAAAAARRR
ncbi:DNA polymerase III subunit delta [Sandarakinorhabdus sp.]|uniref:DNA polymerase III subunit delta n=1 Tax=Sandarakinorhabdus sp. TaxID=1916663 RepID=UPI003F711E53